MGPCFPVPNLATIVHTIRETVPAVSSWIECELTRGSTWRTDRDSAIVPEYCVALRSSAERQYDSSGCNSTSGDSSSSSSSSGSSNSSSSSNSCSCSSSSTITSTISSSTNGTSTSTSSSTSSTSTASSTISSTSSKVVAVE